METDKYLRILETDTIKHVEMKDEIKKKNTSGERENYIVEISWKG